MWKSAMAWEPAKIFLKKIFAQSWERWRVRRRKIWSRSKSHLHNIRIKKSKNDKPHIVSKKRAKIVRNEKLSLIFSLFAVWFLLYSTFLKYFGNRFDSEWKSYYVSNRRHSRHSLCFISRRNLYSNRKEKTSLRVTLDVWFSKSKNKTTSHDLINSNEHSFQISTLKCCLHFFFWKYFFSN